MVHLRPGCTAYLQASTHAFVLQKTRAPIGATSGTELVPNIVDFGSTNWCQLASHSPT